ncbi:MAG: metallophosphoesterase [Comamonadaceae bacterium]|nr:MAG: metallophosphoesterase [Comamonadaceae bacterium]
MNIQLLSDLHLEAHPHFRPEAAEQADLLVLAGDIGSYQRGSRLLDPEFGLARFSPREGWPVPVLFVPGNHEYDNADFDEAHERLRAITRRLGIHWLERETLTWQGVRFVGTTLWADFDALVDPNDSMEQRLAKRGKAMRAANHHLRKTGTTRHGEPFLADTLRLHGLECQNWLRKTLATPFDGPTVVVTHFAPSLSSSDPRYGLTPGTAAFCNALDDLLPCADVWLHGHLHCALDYRKEGCRVVANPLGYAGKGEQEAFVPRRCISLPI